jgi:phospholipase C
MHYHNANITLVCSAFHC